MTLRNHFWFWLLSGLGLMVAVWVLKDVLMPFAVGMLIAYLLGPIVSRMINAGIPRTISAMLILGGFFLLVAGILVVILPFAYREAVQLANDLPMYANKVQAYLDPYMTTLQQKFPAIGDLSGFEDTLSNNIGRIFRFGSGLLLSVVSGGKAIAGMAAFLFVVPVVAFLMMQDWVRITTWIDNMIPRKSYADIRSLLTQMDKKIAGFVRGQLIIAFVLGLAYAVALTLAGLKFGFLIGLMSGLLSVIPLVGSAIGLVVAVIVAWLQAGEWGYVGIIAAIFLVGQFLEGNVITPRILGDSVGLHPLWILFALMAGGSLYGLVGMVIAVPVAAVIGVLVSFGIARYKASPYYGEGEVPARPEKKKKKAKK